SWSPLAPFANYSQWSNGVMSMELFSIHPMDKCANPALIL
ncbi:7415_t:CDS:1, partial [Scutellospora calospora]